MRVLSLATIWIVAALGAAREPAREPARDPLDVSTGAELEEALSGPRHDAVIRLAPGVYELMPEAALDSTCASCANPDTLIPITVGLTISGRNLRVAGPRDGTATIITRAGYGLYFKDCIDCEIDRVTITGGERDGLYLATDAAIVATRSSVTIRNCVVRDDRTTDQIVTDRALSGICVREGADLTIQNCDITRNGAHGISLYGDAKALISNNLIDKEDAVCSEGPGWECGAGIRVHDAAMASIERNLIKRYGFGVSADHNSDVVASGNIIEEVWFGIYLQGAPHVVIERNAVYDCSACGIAVTAGAIGRITSNFVVHTRQGPQDDAQPCYQELPSDLSVRGNVYYDNREVGEDPFGKNTTKEMFWRERRSWVRTFRNTGVGVDGRVKFHESAFLTEYPRWWN